MTKYVYDGIIQVRLVLGLDSAALPAISEWNAGTNLTPFLRALDTPLEGSTVDAHTAETKFNVTANGTYGGQPLTATFTRDKTYADDDAWVALPFGTTGHLVCAWRGGTGALGVLATGDRVDVWEIDVISRNPVPYGKDVLGSFVITAAVPSPPSIDVALLAS